MWTATGTWTCSRHRETDDYDRLVRERRQLRTSPPTPSQPPLMRLRSVCHAGRGRRRRPGRALGISYGDDTIAWYENDGSGEPSPPAPSPPPQMVLGRSMRGRGRRWRHRRALGIVWTTTRSPGMRTTASRTLDGTPTFVRKAARRWCWMPMLTSAMSNSMR